MKQDEKKIAKIRSKLFLMFIWCLAVVTLLSCRVMPVAAANTAADMAVFDGVTVSPDGTAWTTDYLDTTGERLESGYTVYTGVSSSLRELQAGEHYYEVPAVGSINIGKWVVTWPNAQCIHEIPHYNTFHGFPIKSDTICYANYNNGWVAYCADCGELVDEMLFYAKSSTVSNITSMSANAIYLYICPYCQGLEQGRSYTHICKEISYNYYEVSYNANAPGEDSSNAGSGTGTVEGYMPPTWHMYNNASTYNGVSASEQGYGDTKLRANSYSCKGYKFIGWNTKADGSGAYYSDGAEVMNLTDKEGGTVILYAQWEKTKSTLVLDANGGLYDGEAVHERAQEYGTTYQIEDSLITPAPGYTVKFDTNGGSAVASVTTTKSFSHWEVQNGFQGNLENNVYTFTGEDGGKSTLRAQYTNNSFILPNPTKEDASLAGWYSDPSLSEESFVGKPGDEVVVEDDTTLYAKWATLTLWAYDDYESNSGRGAVDLVWEQKDGQSKYYRIFQSLNQTTWSEIFAADTITSAITISKNFGTTNQGETYVIEQTGYYTITANGAKGADYSKALTGGNGGRVTASYWLQEGDIVTFYAGTAGSGMSGGTNKSSSYGGASSAATGRGGGAATEVYVTRNGTKTLLLVAGGGGGANESYSGGNGGTRLTAYGSGAGTASAFGGGGGGAQGGNGGSAAVSTTIADTKDYAFKSNLSANLSAGTVQVYGMSREMQTPTLSKVTGNGQNSWKLITTMGTWSSSFTSSYSRWYDDEYSWFGGYTTGTAAVGTIPYIQIQARDGVDMYLSNIYSTSGNTNLLIGGGLYREDYGAAGNTRLRLTVKNADTGASIYDDLIYYGYSDNDRAGIAVVEDIDISSADRVTVQIKSETEGTQENTAGHKTQLYFSDIIFYGKTVSSAAATTGGSNYINTGFGCKKQASSAGTNAGAGFAGIKSEDIGYKEITSLDNVPAQDTAAPAVVNDYEISIADEKRLNIVLERPADKGTTYYHMAKSYRLDGSTVQQLATSNITENTLTTGVVGYYYYLDTLESGSADVQDSYTHSDSITVTLTEAVMYLHVAAIDGAGNLGTTQNIRLYIDENVTTEPDYAQNGTLFTEQLSLEESDFVYAVSEKIYYVKADGLTEHNLISGAYMDIAATQDYQIGSMYFHTGDNNGTYPEWLKITIPYGNIAENSTSFDNSSLSLSMSDGCINYMLPKMTTAERQDHGTSLSLEYAFTVDSNTETFALYPQAEAELNEVLYFSDESADMVNGITIIPDSIPPVIEGLEELASFDILDMTEQTKVFELQAQDSISGLAEFTVYVSNQDNFIKEEFSSDGDGKIQLEIDKDNPLFVGEIAVSAIALDHVGNANVIGEDGLTFTLETDLYREREPEENIFKTGDGAVLEITTAGYVERIEVIFPEELLLGESASTVVYEYEYPYLRNTETLQFSIPLGIAEKEYEITVKAYKNDEMLVSKPTLIVVEGNVLDELRTRIRDNGQ